MDEAAEECDIRSGANLDMHIRCGGGSCKPGIDHDHLRVALAFGFNRPFESARVVLGPGCRP
jgi:hypothetical protein